MITMLSKRVIVTLLLVGAALGAGFWLWPDRYLLATAWLIMQTTPYEQSGLPDGPVIVVLGDSTAYGTGARNPEESVAGRLGQAYPAAQVVTISSNGWTLADVRAALPLVPDATLVVVMAGGNDILSNRPIVAAMTDLVDVLSRLQAKSADVILLPPGNVGSAPVWSTKRAAVLSARTEQFRTEAQLLTHDLGVGYVDLFLPAETDPMIQDSHHFLALDQLHPSGAGYGLWFTALLATLAERSALPFDELK